MNLAHQMSPSFGQGQWEDLAHYLREELQEYGEFLVLLDEQQKAILSQDTDTLKELEQAIQQQIQLTTDVRTQRTDMVSTLAQLVGMPTDTSLRQILPHFPQAAQPMLTALIEEINALIGKTRKALRQNHILLSRASEVTERLLTALNPTPSTKTYTKSGGLVYKTTRVGSCIRTSA